MNLTRCNGVNWSIIPIEYHTDCRARDLISRIARSDYENSEVTEELEC